MTKLADIIASEGLVPVLLARLVNGIALWTDSVSGHTVLTNKITFGRTLFVYAEALDQAIKEQDSFREVYTSAVISISTLGDSSFVVKKENSTYLLIYPRGGA